MIHRLALRFLIFLSLIIPACSHVSTPRLEGAYGGPVVKVAILKGKDSVTVTGNRLRIRINGKRSIRIGSKIEIAAAPGGYKAGGKVYRADGLEVSGNVIRVNGRPYRGSISVIKEGGHLTVVNRLGMEAYIMGIINHEISSSWPIESVKAQAVAARSYAYEKLKSRADMPYHLESNVMDQVYGGSGSEDSAARNAVTETRGEVLFYGGAVAQALYHSSCGGHTESAGNLWGKDIPYLRGVGDEFCTDAPDYFWTYRTYLEYILATIRERGYKVDDKRMIKIMERNRSGRVRRLEIGGVKMSGKVFREMIGYNRIKSTKFHVDMEEDEVIFHGSGSGHGVGMCQWGAKGMAGEGFDYRGILRHYYPGTKVKKVY